ncbi:hypothetical protein [Achromobacter sp. NFACC18-2]|uniref:hypothetical protein n=1 Tax=Achromobacter sp. NFACC18-2 TaxID=1564112 RepID=UPI0020C8710C|nr:hypothetical protein [Achromobacter sp. NFACC18-2]
MTRFHWEPLDLLEFLGVSPAEAEGGTSYRYVLEQPPLSLVLTIWPLEGDVEVAIRCADMREPVVHFHLLSCPGVRVIDDKWGKFIEFAAANLFAGRVHIGQPAPHGFRLRVEPNLQITTFNHDA